jgi:hypothetical protein
MFTKASLESTKSRLITIMNAQTSFGIAVGIPAVFFLAGFVYNAAQPSPAGAISFGIFWMVLVLVTIISGTLLAGNSPNAVSVLLAGNHKTRPRIWLALLNDMYDSELYPVPMWDRGFSKYKWLKGTTLWQDPRCLQQGVFRKRIEIDRWSWAVITMSTWLLVAIPCLLSWLLDYLLPWPWLGCLSLIYITYLSTQTWLILMALVLAYLNVPFHSIWRPWKLLSKGAARSLFSTSCLRIFAILTGVAALAAVSLTVAGSIFQLSDRFDCFCSTPVSSWFQQPRIAFISFEYTSRSYYKYVDFLYINLYRSAAGFTCVICFFGWWYQRWLRGDLREVIEDIKL